MSLNRISSALLPWFLCLSFLPSRVAWTTESTPTSAAVTPVSAVATEPAINNNNNNKNDDDNNNNMLLFQDGAPGGGLRYCSCPAPPPLHCDETRADLQCSCRGVSRGTLPAAGLAPPTSGGGGGLLTVWLREAGRLQDLLNGSRVGHLQLVSCGGRPLPSQPLALLGLRSLRIHSSVPGAPYPHQELTVAAPDAGALSSSSSSSSVGGSEEEEEEEGEEGEEGTGRAVPPAPLLRLTLLDVVLLNGLSALKAYSVTGRSRSSLATQFPQLPLALLLHPPPAAAAAAASPAPGAGGGPQDQGRDPDGGWVLTFVY